MDFLAARLAAAATLAMLGATLGCKREAPPRPVPEVAVQTLETGRVVLATELPGRTAPYLVAEIRPQVNGLIQQRLFQEGADVKAGSTLYQIDPAQYQAVLDQAAAALAVAESGLPASRLRAERLRSLVATHAVGQQDAEDAEAAYQQGLAGVAAAKAALEGARINLAHTPIQSPISGRTGMSSVTVGALVTAYQPLPLVTVQQLDPIYVDVAQSSADQLRLQRRLAAGRLRSGGDSARAVKLLLEDGTPYPHPGRLQFRDVTVDPATGAVNLRIVVPNPEHTLLPGMFVRAVVEDGIDEHAILAMQQGIGRDTKGDAIALVVDPAGKVAQRTLAVDRALGDKWLVTSGLAAGDRLIVEGLQKVRPGMTVKVVPFTAPTPAAAQ